MHRCILLLQGSTHPPTAGGFRVSAYVGPWLVGAHHSYRQGTHLDLPGPPRLRLATQPALSVSISPPQGFCFLSLFSTFTRDVAHAFSPPPHRITTRRDDSRVASSLRETTSDARGRPHLTPLALAVD